MRGVKAKRAASSMGAQEVQESGGIVDGGVCKAVCKAGGAEGRRRRKEEEERLALIGAHLEERAPALPNIPLINEALGLCKGKGVKLCRCLCHHRPHLHRPCVIDLVIKQACLGGALAIVGRDILAARAGIVSDPGALRVYVSRMKRLLRDACTHVCQSCVDGKHLRTQLPRRTDGPVLADVG